MLDFHIIRDNESRGSHTAATHNYVGGIDYEEFVFWQDNLVFENHLDYYADFLFTSEEVVTKLNLAILTAEKIKLPVHFSLIRILSDAKSQGAGLMAYCD